MAIVKSTTTLMHGDKDQGSRDSRTFLQNLLKMLLKMYILLSGQGHQKILIIDDEFFKFLNEKNECFYLRHLMLNYISQFQLIIVQESS